MEREELGGVGVAAPQSSNQRAGISRAAKLHSTSLARLSLPLSLLDAPCPLPLPLTRHNGRRSKHIPPLKPPNACANRIAIQISSAIYKHVPPMTPTPTNSHANCRN